MQQDGIISTLAGLITDNVTVSAGIALITPLLASGVFSFLRRPRKVGQGEADYLADDRLLAAPIERPAYSDRMAYVLGELSALAYFEFESTFAAIRDAAQSLGRITADGEEQIRDWLEEFSDKLLSGASRARTSCARYWH